ncbi:rhomboid family intramembrane serine protease [Microvirga sp. STR05]|uniref:Rhomboid family intramembrane serine protease n=1 Tax=Hymenobacter duratus TaxID=2771356 RepID=A0ABR8JHU8_9BACT|nr:rhomboid family intramembrane serine protease [Hymenobacter duratus]MBD2714917.1 rhomboid family intramembrane serine protease [Hymenobacter duratus]MBR7949823.1 rhomboid family intramembrane serine protease [Microvirga sp. STR05]
METPPPGPLADKTDAELLYLAQHAARYPAAIGTAAVQELQRRGLIPDELPEAAPPRPPAVPVPDTHWLEQGAQVVRAMLWPRSGYRVTPWLLNANLAVFLLMGLSGVNMLAPAGAALVAWGSNVSSLTPQQPWRLLTSIFLHGGPAHLLLNMSALLLLGLMAEGKAGHWRWLLIYLLSGIGGSLTSLWWHTQGVNSVGASGAIFGLYGLLLALLLTQRTALSRQERAGMLGLLLYFALSSLVGGLEGPAGTDNAAHIGGLLTGLVAGLASIFVWRPK